MDEESYRGDDSRKENSRHLWKLETRCTNEKTETLAEVGEACKRQTDLSWGSLLYHVQLHHFYSFFFPHPDNAKELLFSVRDCIVVELR